MLNKLNAIKTKHLIKSIFYSTVMTAIVFLLPPGMVNAQTRRYSTAFRPAGQSPNGGFFTGGTPSFSRLPAVPEINCGLSKVSFPAGVRTIWHSHAGGQIIVVVAGTAWYQEKGRPKRIIVQGEAVICPPGVMYWHGASPDGQMWHTLATANLDKGGVTAGAAVTDQEYKGS